MPNFQYISEGHADFTFDAKTHTYKIGDKRLISVTESLPYDYHGNNQQAMEKGRYVHETCRLYLLDDLDEDNLDPQLRPYLDALKKFLHDSKGMGITGCFDFKSGSPHPCTDLQISAYIDLVNQWQVWIKTECTMPLLETPLYHTIHQYAGTPDFVIGDMPVREGYALYLKDNGKYSLSPVKDIRKNFEIFLHHFLSYKWQKEKGLI